MRLAEPEIHILSFFPSTKGSHSSAHIAVVSAKQGKSTRVPFGIVSVYTILLPWYIHNKSRP